MIVSRKIAESRGSAAGSDRRGSDRRGSDRRGSKGIGSAAANVSSMVKTLRNGGISRIFEHPAALDGEVSVYLPNHVSYTP